METLTTRRYDADDTQEIWQNRNSLRFEAIKILISQVIKWAFSLKQVLFRIESIVAVTRCFAPYARHLVRPKLFAIHVGGWPPELFSSLIPQKILSTFQALSSPIQYPQYTDTITGDWIYSNPFTWTSDFLPTIGYAVNTRAELCGATSSNSLAVADWLDLSAINEQWAPTAQYQQRNGTWCGLSQFHICTRTGCVSICISSSFCSKAFGVVLLEIPITRPP